MAVDSLGMISGRTFTFHDLGHVEWRPFLSKAQGSGPSGQALANINAGYKWKFPRTVYVWSPPVKNSPDGQSLIVYIFVSVKDDHDRSWIALQSERTIGGFPPNNWAGSWVTYNPPVWLFPAYIPTESLMNYDKLYRAVSSVVQKKYEAGSSPNGNSSKSWTESQGSLEYFPAFGIDDNKLQANVEYGFAGHLLSKNCGESQCGAAAYNKRIAMYTAMHQHSYYFIYRAATQTVGPGHEVTNRWKNINHDPQNGDHIYEGNNSVQNSQLGSVSLISLTGWNRDTGAVGFMDVSCTKPYVKEVRAKMTCVAQPNGFNVTTSSKLPAGAIDEPQPPSWPF